MLVAYALLAAARVCAADPGRLRPTHRCGPDELRAAADVAPALNLVIDLPALYLDYDVAGVAYIGTVPAADLGPTLGIDLTHVNLTTQIGRLQAANLRVRKLTNTRRLADLGEWPAGTLFGVG